MNNPISNFQMGNMLHKEYNVEYGTERRSGFSIGSITIRFVSLVGIGLIALQLLGLI